MVAFLIISWVASIYLSYKVAFVALKKADKL